MAFAASLNKIYAQDLLSQSSSSVLLGDAADLFTETIQIISRSGKIFILTNSNQLMNKGDFITLVLRESGPVARAVVAKNHNGQVGIKILKVYSLARWSKMAKGLDVQIKRGDDSALFVVKKENTPIENQAPSINSEEDLFNDTSLIDEDLSDFYKDNRLIKPDNIVSVAYNQFQFSHDVPGEATTESHSQFAFSWGYQFSDNFWVEGLFGRVQMDGFPAQGTQTIVSNFTGRFKYTFKAPLYSYIMPYIGFQTYSVSSPDAGFVENDTDQARERAQRETDAINGLQTSELAIGVTLLRRLVPGWFLKADLGTDILSLGFAIEF
tara:strand:+ start:13114 stop:14085 length:972 start_codon:yes stop_codon:yes gene_type:complete